MSIFSSRTLDSPGRSDCRVWCDTYVEITQISYRWTIHDFSMRLETNGKYFESSTFAADGNDEMKWRLRLYPKGKASDGNLSVFLHLETSKEVSAHAKCKFCILNDKEEEKVKMICHGTFSPNVKSLGCSEFIKRGLLVEEGNGLLCGDKLKLYCEVQFSTNSINKSSRKKNSKVPMCQLSDDFGKFLQSKDLSDVVVNVKGREFYAHKVVLSARSSVFAAMFKHEVKETIQNRVEITDIEPEVLVELLGFIYTGKCTHLEKMANTLLAAANKYALDRLKALCEESLSSRLSVDNALDVLVLADMHNADRLKADALHFVILHALDVMDTAGWKTMEGNHPHLITEVCKTFATRDAHSRLKSS